MRESQWVIFLINDQGWWIYDRWVARQPDLDLAIEDVIYGLESEIIEIPEGEVITIVEIKEGQI